jgi:ABC-type antimicrobial peptide transport system permease subunit
VHLAIRTTADPAAFAPSLERIVKSVDPDLPIGLIRSMDHVISDAMTPARVTTGLLSIFSAVALLLSVLGLYGVISYVVSRRVHEFGVRLAMGATNAALLRLVVKRAVWLTGTGTVLGLLGAVALSRVLARLVYGVRPEPWLLVAIATVLIVVACFASWLPLRKTLASGPLQALRSD